MCSLSDGLCNVIAGHLIEKWRQPKREKGRRGGEGRGGKTKKERDEGMEG